MEIEPIKFFDVIVLFISFDNLTVYDETIKSEWLAFSWRFSFKLSIKFVHSIAKQQFTSICTVLSN